MSVEDLCDGDASLTGSPSTDMPNLVGPVHIHNPRDSADRTYFDQGAFIATECSINGPGGFDRC